MTMTRRDAIGHSVLALVGVAVCPRVALAAKPLSSGRAAPLPAAASRLHLLGTGGGPVLGGERKMAAHILTVGDAAYLIDCGYGSTQSIVAAQVPLRHLDAIFITHFHADHILDYGPLLFFLPVQGRTRPVDVYGPKPIRDHTRHLEAANRTSLNYFREGLNLAPPPPLRVHELSSLTSDGKIVTVRDDGVARVSCVKVMHPPVEPSFAYRFDLADRSIVFSGDTGYSESLITLAKGADVLVHEAAIVQLVLDMMRQTAATNGVSVDDGAAQPRSYDPAQFEQHVRKGHTSAEDAGRVAAAAGVGTLVLSHISPGSSKLAPDTLWIEHASRHFSGKIIVGHDGMML